MLNALRRKIDKIDKKIKKLLLKRYQVVLEISKIKHTNKLQVLDKKRELETLNNLLNDKNLDDIQIQFLKEIIEEIQKASRKIQK